MTDNPTEEFDVVIAGAGAGGGVAAGVLAEAGKTVLLLERGPQLDWAHVARDHLRNHRIGMYGNNTGPAAAGDPRVFVDPAGRQHLVHSHEDGYHNNAAVVGGGTLVYGAQAWRFMPQDFRMASLYGVPAGSSLADWPIEYADLAPDYDRAEWELGVSGDAGLLTLHGPRERGFPMPPVPSNPQRELFGAAAARLGWQSAPVPLLINTVPYNGRPPCVQCGACVGFACPSDGKTGSQNTMIPRALATGRCTLRSGVMVERIDTDGGGRVTGLSYFTTPGRRTTIRAKIVIVAGGAIETARLLLNSRSDQHPAGLGNHSDHVGRHLQGHYYPGALGQFDEVIHTNLGPGVSIATCQFNHGNPGIVGGGMLANEFTKLPIIFWKTCLPPRMKRWGLEAKHYMRDSFSRVAHVQGPVQEIPSPEGRVTIDPAVRDQFGIPVVRLSGTQHIETLHTAEFMRHKAEEWLHAAGAKKVWSGRGSLNLSGGQHQAGTTRMGHDPKMSVTNPFGRVHGHDNLFVADGGLHVTNGGFNPVLTIMALAFRVSRHVAEAM